MTRGLGLTSLNLTRNLIGGVYESGALFSFAGNPSEINIRVGVSFVSTDQACANAESEVGDAAFEDIVDQSKALWNEKLSKIEIDLKNTPANVTELLYSSLYRASLTPVRTPRYNLRIVIISHITRRTTRLRRLKGHLQVQLIPTSTHYTAGENVCITPDATHPHYTMSAGTLSAHSIP